ncbi:hypothetical protein DNTS_014376 [Danionella cerebrum]|uniref:Uncharacterized protein n=1 Tax=Danionella cerebrum TaxID=2873325 RepID=A0A553QTE0_9TELE|nr:hypothetical protein DNTS_014376 [Danionella translucida]
MWEFNYLGLMRYAQVVKTHSGPRCKESKHRPQAAWPQLQAGRLGPGLETAFQGCPSLEMLGHTCTVLDFSLQKLDDLLIVLFSTVRLSLNRLSHLQLALQLELLDFVLKLLQLLTAVAALGLVGLKQRERERERERETFKLRCEQTALTRSSQHYFARPWPRPSSFRHRAGRGWTLEQTIRRHSSTNMEEATTSAEHAEKLVDDDEFTVHSQQISIEHLQEVVEREIHIISNMRKGSGLSNRGLCDLDEDPDDVLSKRLRRKGLDVGMTRKYKLGLSLPEENIHTFSSPTFSRMGLVEKNRQLYPANAFIFFIWGKKEGDAQQWQPGLLKSQEVPLKTVVYPKHPDCIHTTEPLKDHGAEMLYYRESPAPSSMRQENCVPHQLWKQVEMLPPIKTLSHITAMSSHACAPAPGSGVSVHSALNQWYSKSQARETPPRQFLICATRGFHADLAVCFFPASTNLCLVTFFDLSDVCCQAEVKAGDSSASDWLDLSEPPHSRMQVGLHCLLCLTQPSRFLERSLILDLVTPKLNLNILISATSISASCLFLTATVSNPYIITGLTTVLYTFALIQGRNTDIPYLKENELDVSCPDDHCILDPQSTRSETGTSVGSQLSRRSSIMFKRKTAKNSVTITEKSNEHLLSTSRSTIHECNLHQNTQNSPYVGNVYRTVIRDILKFKQALTVDALRDESCLGLRFSILDTNAVELFRFESK